LWVQGLQARGYILRYPRCSVVLYLAAAGTLAPRLLDAEPSDIKRRQDILMSLGAKLVENQTFASSLGAYQFFAASGPSTATLRRDYSGPVRTD
jgi:hypothetical protein